MRIFVASDLHGEMGDHGYDVPAGLDFDVAVLAGDIGRGPAAIDWILRQEALRDKPVMFVAGNHEYYRGVLQDVAAEMRDACRGTNVHFLDADTVPIIDGVRFVGCTLWTDYLFGARNQMQGLWAGMRMNDHRFIRTSAGAEFPMPFRPPEAYMRHVDERRWLTDRLADEHDGPTVVVTHHAPHPGSLHERYEEEGALNASFISDLSGIIEAFKPALWIHGHVHDGHDYDVGGGTRIVCNPRGYSLGNGLSENAGFVEDLVIELPEWIPAPTPW